MAPPLKQVLSSPQATTSAIHTASPQLLQPSRGQDSIHTAVVPLPCDAGNTSCPATPSLQPTTPASQSEVSHTLTKGLSLSSPRLHHQSRDVDSIKYQLIDVPGNGDCFFSCLSVCLTGTAVQARHYRHHICMYIYNNWENWAHLASMYHTVNTKENYYTRMMDTHEFATGCEVKAASMCFQRTIAIWLRGQRFHEEKNAYVPHFTIEKYECLQNNSIDINLLLSHNHFQVMLHEAQLSDILPHTPTSMQHSPGSNHNQKKGDQQDVQGRKRKCAVDNGQNIQLKCRKQQVCYDPPVDGETSEQRKTRYRRNWARLRRNEQNCGKRKRAFNTEETIRTKCLKYNVQYDPPDDEETPKDRRTRLTRNRSRVRRQEHKMSHNTVQTTPDEITVQHAVDAIKSFEKEQMSYSFNTCCVCNECRLNPKMFGNTCVRCAKDKKGIKMFSKENFMDPGVLPDELKGLSVVEEQLICQIAPSMSIHLLKHGGIGASGHCIAFPQEINEPAQILPRLPSDINIICVRKTGRNETSKDFKIRRCVVQRALEWLQTNNHAYQDILISKERLSNLPEDGELQDIQIVEYDEDHHLQDKGPAEDQTDPGETEADTTSSVLLPEVTVDIRQKVEDVVKEVVGEEHGPVTSKRGIVTIPWPTRDAIPVSEYTTVNFFTLAFPALFPYGTADYHMNRPRTCESMSDWAEHLLWYKDGRFANHKFFKFVAHNIIMRKRTTEQSRFIVRQQLRDQHITVEDLKLMLKDSNNGIAKKILYFGASLRGTSQYWAQKSRELRAMIQYQINEGHGLPAFFATGSCAEYHWKPLRRLLDTFLQMTGSSEIQNKTDLFEAIQKHAHIVGAYFDQRTVSYFSHVMRNVFGVEDFWFRYEFAKMRGQIHWHGLAWRHDREPHNLLYQAVLRELSDNEMAQELAQWAYDVFGMTAMHPAGTDDEGFPRKNLWPPPEGTAQPPAEEDNPLVQLLSDISNDQDSMLQDHLQLTNRINIHRCSDYCYRKTTKAVKTCRLEFGTQKEPGKQLRDAPAIVLDKNKCMRLEMPRDHPMLVQHSRHHTQGWRANGDISIIISKSEPSNPALNEIIATEKYVSGYACKGNQPTGAMADLFSDLVHTADDNTLAKSVCTKLLMNTVKRDISTAEACYELSALPLYRCSRTFQYLSMTGSRVLERTGKTATKNTALDKYLARENDKAISWYSYICSSGKVPVVGGNVQATWPLTVEYARTMLLLHWPNWRKISDIVDVDPPNWLDKFLQFLASDQCPSFVKADVERAKNNYPSATNGDEEEDHDNAINSQQPEWMELLQPNTIYDDFVDDFQYWDGGPDFDWGQTAELYPTNRIDFLANLRANADSDDANDSVLTLPDVNISSLNQQQLFAFKLVTQRLQSYKHGEDVDPLRLVVAGQAGSGKSFLIKCLVHAVRSMYQNNRAVQVICPTGNSANLINGVTLHSFLKIPCGAQATKEMSPPTGATGEILQKNCENLQCLLVDERSLIGCTTLGWMEFHARCGMNRGKSSHKEWGGLPVVVFFGDDIQLPPVCDSPVYMCNSKKPAAIRGALIWKTFDCVVTLNKVVRQSEDQAELKAVLNAMRDYTTTPQQAQWLQRFQWSNLRKLYGNDAMDEMTARGLFVFPTHEAEWNHNKTALLKVNQQHPVAKVSAQMEGMHATKSSADKAGGLVRVLYITIGARIMLTCNILVKHGLFNGAVGTVKDIIYSDGKSPRDRCLPEVVLVDFPEYSGPPFLDSAPTVIPIVPETRRLDCGCCRRKQIPLRLGWGTTIHRCQGMTIGENQASRFIVIHPGGKVFESRNPGALYVALSRAKSAGNQGQLPDFAWNPSILLNTDRICHQVHTATVKARAKEIARLQQLEQNTKQTYGCLLCGPTFNPYVSNSTEE